MILLVSCTNDDYDTLSDKEHLVKITAIADFATSSRIYLGDYIYYMEIYEDQECMKMVGTQYSNEEGIFKDIILDSSKTYYAIFWADNDFERDTYDVTSLKAVTLIDGMKPIEAFAGKIMIKGKANNVEVSLNRVVANIKLMENGAISNETIKLQFTQPTTYNVATDVVSGENTRIETIQITSTVDGTYNNVCLNTSPIYILASSLESEIKLTLDCKGPNMTDMSRTIPLILNIQANYISNLTGHYTYE